ncbi:MAG: glycosyltransferase [Hyphomicrobiaceae bacterium]|nr:glycosyltransferase [Hyphomicrobiaceae bacterium]
MATTQTSIGALQIVQRMGPGGIETMALDLMRDPILGGDIISLAGTTGELVQGWPALAPLAGRIRGLGQGTISHGRLIAMLVRLLRRARPRAVIAHHIGPLLHGGIAARIAGVPNVIHVEHDAWHYADAKHRMIARVCERLVRPRHVAVSEEVAASSRKVLPGADFSIVAPGIDMERYHPADRTAARSGLGLSVAGCIVGSVGRLAEVKGHRHLVKALTRLPPDVHAVIVGDGPERAMLEGLALELGVAGRLHLLGLRSDAERIIPAFDVFCLPSMAEGLPRALIEAQACGVPAVASDVGGVSRALAPGGRLVVAGDADALAGAIREVLAAPPPAAVVRAHVAERFSLEATVLALRSLVGEGP